MAEHRDLPQVKTGKYFCVWIRSPDCFQDAHSSSQWFSKWHLRTLRLYLRKSVKSKLFSECHMKNQRHCKNKCWRDVKNFVFLYSKYQMRSYTTNLQPRIWFVHVGQEPFRLSNSKKQNSFHCTPDLGLLQRKESFQYKCLSVKY